MPPSHLAFIRADLPFSDHETKMKPMREENQMSHYLLGLLPEPEAAALEQAFFADDEAFERMWEVENDLVDRYVRGRLAPGEREPFERHYLASPVHRQRVAAARNLLFAADALPPAQSVAAESIPASWAGRFASRRASPAMGRLALATAMLLLAAGCAWLLSERGRQRGDIARLQAERAAQESRERELAGQIATGQSERDRLSAELEQLRKQRTEPRPVQSQTPPPASTIFAFTLSTLGNTREGAGQSLAVGPGADQIQFQLTPRPGDWKSFQASIQTAEHQPVWSQQGLKSRAGKVVVTVPAGKLPFKHYILTLSGTNRAGETEEINRYSFLVTRE